MFGMNKPKKYKKKIYKKSVSRVDRIISLLEAADKKDREESNKPKRKYIKSNKHRRDNFQIGW
jgi:hypothetical protein